jgi:Outer membrane efflux protein
MTRAPAPFQAIALTCLLCAGCLQGQRAHRADVCASPGAAEPSEVQLPLTKRGHLEPDPDRIRTAPGDDQSADLPCDRATQYQALTERQCQCLAAQHASAASVLEGEARVVGERPRQPLPACGQKKQARAGLQQTVLTYAALEARNLAAGQALELYYRLAEAEAKLDLTRAGLAQLGDAVARARQMEQRGLPTPPALDALQEQRSTLLANCNRLRYQIRQLNSGLARLLGLAPNACVPGVWPVTDLALMEEPPDLDSCVALGLAHRPQLHLLRAVSQQLSATTLPTARQVLRSVNPLAGMVESEAAGHRLAGCLAPLVADGGGARGREVEARQAQLRQLIDQRERAVAEETCLAFEKVQAQARLVAVARDKVNRAREKVNKQRDRLARGLGSALEVTTSRLDWFKARAELVEEVVGWHVARVKLKEARGLLVLECGYVCPPPPTAASETRPVSPTPCVGHQR